MSDNAVPSISLAVVLQPTITHEDGLVRTTQMLAEISAHENHSQRLSLVFSLCVTKNGTAYTVSFLSQALEEHDICLQSGRVHTMRQ